MHYISSNVKKMIEHMNLSISEVARTAGISKATISRWFNEEKTPRLDMIEKIASAYNMPLDYFLDDSFTEYWELTEDGWVEKGNPENETTYEVSAGNGRINDGYCSRGMGAHGDSDEYSIIKICGDSMYPILHDGDKVKIHHQSETSSTDLTVVKIDGESSTIKYLEIVSDGIWLRAENKDVFEDRHYTISEVMSLPITVIGKAVAIVERLL